jgi:FixJ family two-component response regulator
MLPEPTVFLIDDDEAVCTAIATLLESVGLRTEPFASTREFLKEQQDAQAHGCLVLDVRLRGASGLEFQRELAAAGLNIPIIFLSGHADIPMTVQAMKAGAVDFLTKPFRDQDLLDAIQRAISRDRARREETSRVEEARKRVGTLTPREREVMALVIRGMVNKQIAAELGTSETTAKIHRGQVMRKMRVQSLPDLVRMAQKIGM